MAKVLVDKNDLDKILDYLIVSCREERDYLEWGLPRPKNHIWLVVKRIKKSLGGRK